MQDFRGRSNAGARVHVGRRPRSPDLNSAAHFFIEVLGLSVSYQNYGVVQFELPSGQLFEVFGSESRFYPLHACPVLAFQVEDVRRLKLT